MRPVRLLAVYCVALSTLVAPLPAGAQSLQAELRGLLASHPVVREREKQVEAARQGIDGAFSTYLPRVDVSGEVGPQRIDSPVTRDAGGGDFSAVKQVARLSATQRIFDGFSTPAEVRGARLNLEVAQYTLSGTRQNALFDGLEAYIEVLRQKKLLELAHTSEATIKRQLNLEDERVKRGAGIAVDVLQAKSRLQVAKEQRVAFEGAVQDAIARYIRVFGHAPDTASMDEPDLPEAEIPENLDRALMIAGMDNPAIGSSLATVEVASEQRRLARSGYFPTIDLVAQANREKDNDLVEGTRKDYSVFLRATWNLFSGFKTTSSVRQAAFDYRASQDNYDMVHREVVEATRLAWNELETARARMELLINGIAIAEEVFEFRQKLRSAGRETAINVLDAENELLDARISFTEAKGDHALAVYRMLQGMGRLDTETLGIH
ncbi:MAG: TolC family outer membrane protein [Hyphomicrobiales bacterium]|nr:TolC family outer membrane protein [Hyphomicrobiales bacterium]